MFASFLQIDFSLSRTVVVLLGVLSIAVFDITKRLRTRKSHHYVFAVILGTVLSVGLIKSARAILMPGVVENTFAVALGVLLIILLWRMLFGPWEVPVKATVLGTFLFWVSIHILWRKDPDERLLMVLASLVALIPAILWAMIFLSYHAERRSKVVLMFFAGILSTFPVLFYDALIRNGVELQFFIFRIVPESFSRIAHAFVSSQFGSDDRVLTTIFTLVLSYMFVGLIEEASKLWVLKRSGDQVFSSIDDVLQLSIVVALGFAFAENIVNPTYFLTFIRQDLIGAPGFTGFGSFFSNVAGRSVLTSMVHVTATGILGYFLGRAIFAGSCLEEDQHTVGTAGIFSSLGRLLRFPELLTVRRGMILLGFILAVGLHALSNVLVTLPDALPGKPQTLGQLLGSPEDSFLHVISLLLIPSFLYVVGGFWLLTFLFDRKENMKERGCLIREERYLPLQS